MSIFVLGERGPVQELAVQRGRIFLDNRRDHGHLRDIYRSRRGRGKSTHTQGGGIITDPSRLSSMLDHKIWGLRSTSWAEELSKTGLAMGCFTLASSLCQRLLRAVMILTSPSRRMYSQCPCCPTGCLFRLTLRPYFARVSDGRFSPSRHSVHEGSSKLHTRLARYSSGLVDGLFQRLRRPIALTRSGGCSAENIHSPMLLYCSRWIHQPHGDERGWASSGSSGADARHGPFCRHEGSAVRHKEMKHEDPSGHLRR